MSSLVKEEAPVRGEGGGAVAVVDKSVVTEVGAALRRRRGDVSQLPSATSAISGVQPVDLNAIERGERLPTRDELRRLLDALTISAEDFASQLSGDAGRAVLGLVGADAPGGAPARQEAAPDVRPAQEAAPARAARPDARRPPPNDDRASAGRGGRAASPKADGAKRGTAPGGPTLVTLPIVRANIGALFERVHNSRPGEIVYRWEHRGVGLVVKVYTSIHSESLEAYPTGRDAFRVIVWDRRAERKVEAWSCRINRTGRWPLRLRRLAGEAIVRASFRPRCPRCEGRPEMVITGKSGGQFWGCANYKRGGGGCTFTRDVVLGEDAAGSQEKGVVIGTPEQAGPRGPRQQAAAHRGGAAGGRKAGGARQPQAA